MPDNRKSIYWDACVFLSYVNGMEDRIPVLDALLEESANGGAIMLYTSTVSYVEVAFAASEQIQKVLNPEIEKQINALWSAITTVEYHEVIGQCARDLMRNTITKGWSLKPLDAIHLATAQWLSDEGHPIDEFHTYDDKLHRYASIVDFPIYEPYIEQPRMIS